MKIVVALGGNAIAGKSLAETVRALRRIAPVLVELIQKHHVVIVHGSGPQAGALLLQNELTKKKIPELPLDVIDAEVQGQLGYIIEQVLMNEMHRRKVNKHIVTVITRVLVDAKDKAFTHPSKPVGAFYTKAHAMRLCKHGMTYRDDAGRGYRRFVASPHPLGIVESTVIRTLLADGITVIAAGGGGIPVVKNKGRLHGVAAVIDKDLAASVVGKAVRADVLLIVTAVPSVYLNYQKSNHAALKKIHLKDAKKYLNDGHFAEGSMEPKIEAALLFLLNGGKKVVITDISHCAEALAGRAGTTIIL